MAWICLVPAMLLLLLLKGEASDGKAVSATKESAASNEGDGTLRVKDIRYLNSPTNSCSQNDKDEMLFLILVHSRPEDLEHRQLVRETWGSVRSIKGKRIKTVFVMGRPREQEPRAKTLRRFDFNHVALMVMATRLLRGRSIEGQTAAGVKTGKKKVEGEDGLQGKRQREQPPAARGSEQEKLDSEALLFGDILQGDFLDSAANSTLKHLLGHRWAASGSGGGGCEPTFVVNTGDDVFVEIFHLAKFVEAIYGGNPRQRLLVCEVVPNSKSAVNSRALSHHLPHRRQLQMETWDIAEEEEEEPREPRPRAEEGEDEEEQEEEVAFSEYCGRSGYLMSPDLAGVFVEAAEKVPLWEEESDSESVTGRLRSSLGVSPFYLNLRYTGDPQACLRWLRGRTTLPMPHLFAGLSDRSLPGEWEEIYRELWEKTVRVHHYQQRRQKRMADR